MDNSIKQDIKILLQKLQDNGISFVGLASTSSGNFIEVSNEEARSNGNNAFSNVRNLIGVQGDLDQFISSIKMSGSYIGYDLFLNNEFLLDDSSYGHAMKEKIELSEKFTETNNQVKRTHH